MIITCPHCQTKYQVTYEAIGSAGRKVQCAHCNRAWQQTPLSAPQAPPPADDGNDRLFDSMAEDALDEIMAAEENMVAAERALRGARTETPAAPVSAAAPTENPEAPAAGAAPANPAELRKQQAAFSRRQNELAAKLPLARLRRAARVAGVLILLAMGLTAYFGRIQLVDRYPDLAGLYEAVGLGVNVVGLDFSNLQTIRSASGGKEILTVSAQIVGVSPQPVLVPPVIVSLLDASGNAVYEWSVTPQVPDLMAGERATFETRLTAPPSQATRVRLNFGGSSRQLSPVTAAPASAAPAEAATHTTPSTPPAEPEHGAEPAHH